MNPLMAFELLFFAVFGQTTPQNLQGTTLQPWWTLILFKFTGGKFSSLCINNYYVY